MQVFSLETIWSYFVGQRALSWEDQNFLMESLSNLGRFISHFVLVGGLTMDGSEEKFPAPFSSLKLIYRLTAVFIVIGPASGGDLET